MTRVRLLLIFLLAAALPAGLSAEGAGEGKKGGGRPPDGSQQDAAAEKEPESYGRTPGSMVPYGRSEEPYRRFFSTPPLYRGSGRYEPEPEGLDAVRIGLLAPLHGSERSDEGQRLMDGVRLRLDEANAEGGFRGLPFELVPRNDQALWGSSGNTLVELAYGEKVWAVIGSIDSTSTHVALRAALKAEIIIVNVGSADPTMTETGIPWIIRCTPDDRQTGYRLARHLFEERGLSRVGVLRAGNRYGRVGIKEFRDAARRMGHAIPLELQFPPDQEEFGSQLDRLARAAPEAVVLWTGARQAALILKEMRRRGIELPVYGTDRLATREFIVEAGEAAEGVVATSWLGERSDSASWDDFEGRYMVRYGNAPDAYAAYGYEATGLLVNAIRTMGLNRARIRDALTDIRVHDGVAGRMVFDETSNNVSPLFLVRVQGGRFVFD